jgi:hypothetical protein
MKPEDTTRASEEETTDALIKNTMLRSLDVAKMLQQVARDSGVSPLEAALGMQLATIYILSLDPALAGAYMTLRPALLNVAKRSGLESYTPTQPDPTMPVPSVDVGLRNIDEIRITNSTFELGPIYLSEKVKETLSHARLLYCLDSYSQKKWGGYLSTEESERNDQNVASGTGTIFAIYLVNPKEERSPENTFYVITAPDRSRTDILMSLEY